LENKQDNDILIENPVQDQVFNHIFIVNGISILDRSHDKVKYEFKLISYNWYKLSSNLHFSNYNSNGNKKDTVFEIIRRCHLQKGLRLDKDSFDNVKSDVKLNYITNSNDNCMTVTRYLLNRLYYQRNRDSSMKFLVYNEQYDAYHIFDLADKSTASGYKAIVISFFKSNIELLTVKDPNQLGTISTFPKTSIYQNLF